MTISASSGSYSPHADGPNEPSAVGQPANDPSVIEMDPDDDIGSLRQKLDQTESRRVVLVAPRHAKLLRNPVRLKLLRRYARQSARDVVIIAEDGDVRRLAKAEGFRVAGSIKGVKFGKGSGRSFALPTFSAGGMIAGGVLVGLLVLVALAGAAIILPSATIDLAVAATPMTETMTVKASRQARGVNVDQRSVSGRLITTEAEATDTTEATGKKSTPSEKAKGRVTLTNRAPADNGAVTIPKGSLVRTLGNIQFATDEAVTVPASSASVQAPITAVESGVSANVAARAITAFSDQALNSRVTVVNEQPTNGGTQSDVAYVTLADRNRLRQSILEKLRTEGYARLYDSKRGNESIYRETVQVTVIEETFDRLLDEEAKTVSIVARARVSAIAFNSEDVLDLGQQVAKSQLTAGHQILPGSLTVAPLGLLGADDDAVTFNMSVTFQAMPQINQEQVKNAIAGQPIDQASAYLESTLALTRPPSIRVWPTVMPFIPRLAPRIELTIVGG
ncbi:MAG: baseplate J/gp47 family protein [Dehalococcoidia bacterium]